MCLYDEWCGHGRASSWSPVLDFIFSFFLESGHNEFVSLHARIGQIVKIA